VSQLRGIGLRPIGIALLALGFLPDFGASAYGHLPPGEIFKAFHFPDRLVPVIDGDLSDWDLIDQSFVITTEDFHDLVHGADPNPGDFSVRLMVGWNKAENKLYVAAQVRDDVHQIDRPEGTAPLRIWQDDSMNIFVDSDHSGGQYANFRDLSAEEQFKLNGSAAQHFVIAGPPPDEDFFINFSAAGWYALADGPFTAAAYALDGMVGGPAVLSYEFMLTPFDRVDMRTNIFSEQHILQENETIGFNIEFNDFDTSPVLFDAKWSLSGGQNAHMLSERFADLMLMPPAQISSVQAASWGQVKALFKP
jgi:hypothetical protein